MMSSFAEDVASVERFLDESRRELNKASKHEPMFDGPAETIHEDVSRRVKHDNRRYYTEEEKRRLLSIVTDETWIQHQYARDEEGKLCHPCSPDAVRWDLIGACAYLGLSSMPLYEHLMTWNPLLPKWLSQSVVIWQDSTSWAEVSRFLSALETM